MKFVKQRYLHKPEINQHGDCWAACIASITEIPLEEIPDPNALENKEWSVYWNNMWTFLSEKGWNLYVENIPNYECKHPCMAIGKSPRGDFNHAVVWDNGIIHDPHPDNTGIHNILHFEILEKI